jgi:hypothetical protein
MVHHGSLLDPLIVSCETDRSGGKKLYQERKKTKSDAVHGHQNALPELDMAGRMVHHTDSCDGAYYRHCQTYRRDDRYDPSPSASMGMNLHMKGYTAV